jgi:hypothetical protein
MNRIVSLIRFVISTAFPNQQPPPPTIESYGQNLSGMSDQQIHYLLVLDPESPSRKELGILSDWFFEEDAEPLVQELPSTKPNERESQQGNDWQQPEG